MSETRALTGQCLCGAVSIQANDAEIHASACHCGTCRRWGGGPFLGVQCQSHVSISGQDHVSVFSSSDWAERGFCSTCGTHLFYHLKATENHPGEYHMPVGLFDNTEHLSMNLQVFIDEKPDLYHFGNPTEELTGEQIFALYAPSES